MQVLRKIFIVCFAFFANQMVQAQSNPGYLGRKNLIQLDMGGLMGNAIFEGPLLNTNLGFSYEMARKEDFAWNFGYSLTSQSMNINQINYEGLYFENPSTGNYPDNIQPSEGTIDYSFNEIKVAPKWFHTGEGGIAPYGNNSSLELSLGFLSVDPKITKWPKQLNAENQSIKSIPTTTVFSISYFFGGRRMFTDQIGFEYNVGIGYTFYQSMDGNLFTFMDEYRYLNDLNLFYGYTALKHISSAKLFQGKIGLCYLL